MSETGISCARGSEAAKEDASRRRKSSAADVGGAENEVWIAVMASVSNISGDSTGRVAARAASPTRCVVTRHRRVRR